MPKEPEKYRPIERTFRTLDLTAFARRCDELSFAIRERRPRSTEERVALAQEAAEALTEAYLRLGGDTHKQGSPEAAARVLPVSQAFGEWHESLRRGMRSHTIHRAAAWALRERAEAWLRGRANDEPAAFARAVVAADSDEGLQAMLQELQALVSAPTPASPDAG